MDGKVLEVRQIESIEPDHRFRPFQTMIMPVPSGSQDHIAPLHRDPLPMDSSKAAFAFDNKSHSERSVSMRGSCFVRHDELQSGV